MVIIGCSRLAADDHCSPQWGPSPSLAQKRVPGCTAPSAPPAFGLCPLHGRHDGERGTWGWNRMHFWTKKLRNTPGFPVRRKVVLQYTGWRSSGIPTLYSQWFWPPFFCLSLLVGRSTLNLPRNLFLSTVVIKPLA